MPGSADERNQGNRRGQHKNDSGSSREARERLHPGTHERREWGLRMLIVSRCLERIGDHAVDIGEQTAFLVTGEFREFTDASH